MHSKMNNNTNNNTNNNNKKETDLSAVLWDEVILLDRLLDEGAPPSHIWRRQQEVLRKMCMNELCVPAQLKKTIRFLHEPWVLNLGLFINIPCMIHILIIKNTVFIHRMETQTWTYSYSWCIRDLACKNRYIASNRIQSNWIQLMNEVWTIFLFYCNPIDPTLIQFYLLSSLLYIAS